jgi:hypothetical protein
MTFQMYVTILFVFTAQNQNARERCDYQLSTEDLSAVTRVDDFMRLFDSLEFPQSHFMLESSEREPLPNPIIVFDHDGDELFQEDAPILLRYRQPSFTRLGLAPTPKGFRSLSDFHANQISATLLPSPHRCGECEYGAIWRTKARGSQLAGGIRMDSCGPGFFG